MTMTNDQACDRLTEIRDEIAELVSEAMQIVRDKKGDSADSAKGYWYAQIVMALGDDHDYLARGSYTMSDTIEEFSDIDDDDDDEEDDDLEWPNVPAHNESFNR